MKEALGLAVGGGRRRLSAREEELLGLLAGIPDGGDGDGSRELSFSDLVRPPSADAEHAEPDPGDPAAAVPREDDRPAAAASKKRQQQQAARQRAARRSGGSRGSCGGGGDGVLLNFYVPGLLTRSMTTPKPSRGGLPSHGALQGAPAKTVAAAAVAGKASRSVRQCRTNDHALQLFWLP